MSCNSCDSFYRIDCSVQQYSASVAISYATLANPYKTPTGAGQESTPGIPGTVRSSPAADKHTLAASVSGR